MKIYVDTRQKVGKHDLKHDGLEKLGYELVRKKLEVGDYMLEGNNSVSVDTKQGCSELYTDLIKDRDRFNREIRRATAAGIHLFVLVESQTIKSVPDIVKYKPKYGTCSGQMLFERMLHLLKNYNVDFVFCNKRKTASKIVELLQEGTNRR